jgi:serine/threonine protein kinase
MAWREGDAVGNYKLGKMLGQGGMATVYKAYHEALDREVAIKVMHQNFLDDEGFVARFRREAQLVARLSHSNIVPVYDFGEHDNQPYLVMKYIEGETLKQRLARQPLELDEILAIMTAVGGALSYAHKQDILHRDIKPSNIVIDKDHKPYLTDFGLARLASSGESTMSADMLLGTPHYISPEQAKGAKDIDGRADIYSLGIVLYELLIGRVPFTADTPYAIIHDHIYGDLPEPSKINPEIPLAVEAVILQALEKNPDNRFADADEMIKDLRDAIEETNLTELNPDRATLALASLAEARAEFEVNEGTPRLSRAQTISEQTPITGTQTPEQMKTSPLYQVDATLTRKWYQDERIWPIGGCASFLLIALVSLGILLGMSNNIAALVALTADGESAEEFQEGFADGMRDADVRPVYQREGIRYDSDIPAYLIPEIPAERATSYLDDFPDDPLSYLLQARAVWEDDPSEAQTTLLSGLQYTDETVGMTDYLSSAAEIAKQVGDERSAVLLSIITLQSAYDTGTAFDQLRPRAGEYVYTHADAIELRNLSNLGRDLVDVGMGSLANLETLAIARLATIKNQIEDGNLFLARQGLRDVNPTDELFPEFNLLRAELAVKTGNLDEARNIIDNIQRARDIPQWIHDRADDLQNTIDEEL